MTEKFTQDYIVGLVARTITVPETSFRKPDDKNDFLYILEDYARLKRVLTHTQNKNKQLRKSIVDLQDKQHLLKVESVAVQALKRETDERIEECKAREAKLKERAAELV